MEKKQKTPTTETGDFRRTLMGGMEEVPADLSEVCDSQGGLIPDNPSDLLTPKGGLKKSNCKPWQKPTKV